MDFYGKDKAYSRQSMYGERRAHGELTRSKLTADQVQVLLEVYWRNPKPNSYERNGLAERLGLRPEKIKNWFQNKRAKDRKSKSEGPCLEYDTVSENIWVHSIYPSCNDLYRRREM